MEQISLETINNLELLKKAMIGIKIEMNNTDDDAVLTNGEIRLVDESIKNEKQGKLISSEQLKKIWDMK